MCRCGCVTLKPTLTLGLRRDGWSGPLVPGACHRHLPTTLCHRGWPFFIFYFFFKQMRNRTETLVQSLLRIKEGSSIFLLFWFVSSLVEANLHGSHIECVVTVDVND